VDIAAGSGAFAAVQGDSVTGQGLYVVGPHSAAVITEPIATPNVSNPRIDQVVLEVFDNTLDASGLNIARVRVIAGTPTAGTTLSSRAGVAALPASALLLADILVTAGATSVSNTQIRDRRKWARGAFRVITRTTNEAGGADYAVTATPGNLDATNLTPRIECSGVPLRIALTGQLFSSAGADVTIALQMDGVTVQVVAVDSVSSTLRQTLAAAAVIIPPPGSHTFNFRVNTNTNTMTVIANGATNPLTASFEELVRQNATNASVTSG